ncbi:hypothetical protein [Maricaulis sp.]
MRAVQRDDIPARQPGTISLISDKEQRLSGTVRIIRALSGETNTANIR